MTAEGQARRYKVGQDFFYDFRFASEVRHSEILNGNFSSDLGELAALLESREESLQLLEDDLAHHMKNWNFTRQTNHNRGQKTVEDDRTREKRISLETSIDVAKWEIKTLQQAIEEAEKEKEEQEVPPCLPAGPQGMNKVRGSSGCGYLDGQRVEPVDGIAVITDERSPFRGLSVMDYTQFVCKPWKQACQMHTNEMRKKLTNEGVPRERQRQRYDVPWPEYPARCKNHLNSNGRTAEVKGVLVRSKKKVK